MRHKDGSREIVRGKRMMGDSWAEGKAEGNSWGLALPRVIPGSESDLALIDDRRRSRRLNI